MKAADVKPDCVVFNTLLSAAERAKNPGKALVSELGFSRVRERNEAKRVGYYEHN
jgi:hypothetical protein